MRIHSSFNSDRIAACLLGRKPHVQKARKPYYIAQYRGNVVSILGARGGLLHTWTLSSNVASAIIQEGILSVEADNGEQWTFDVKTGKMLSHEGLGQKVDFLSQSMCSAA